MENAAGEKRDRKESGRDHGGRSSYLRGWQNTSFCGTGFIHRRALTLLLHPLKENYGSREGCRLGALVSGLSPKLLSLWFLPSQRGLGSTSLPPLPTPCIQSSGFREAVNDSLELRTRGGISALLCEELRRGFNVFVGLASPRK